MRAVLNLLIGVVLFAVFYAMICEFGVSGGAVRGCVIVGVAYGIFKVTE